MSKPFNPLLPVQTRDGRKARILCTDFNDVWPIVAAVAGKNYDIEVIRYYREGGLVSRNYFPMSATSALTDPLLDPDDLINIPERTSNWVNVYERGVEYCCREDADKVAGKNRMAIIEIIFEDGKPVDVKLHRDEK